jgi:hypothetical protein
VVTARGTDAGPGGVLRRLAAVALVALALAGCASDSGGQPAASGGTSTLSGRLLVDYRRSGGLTGRIEHLVVNSDGGAVLEGTGPRRDARLDAATMRRLVATLDRADLPKLRSRYAPPARGNDLVTHVITYQGRTVTVTDTAVPAPLRPVLTELNRVVIQVRGG